MLPIFTSYVIEITGNSLVAGMPAAAQAYAAARKKGIKCLSRRKVNIERISSKIKEIQRKRI
jgi:hypothetical protein